MSSIAPPPRSRRTTISYRLSLVLAIPLLIVVTGALIATNSYLTTRATVADLTGNLFGEAAQQTASVSRAHVAQAMPAVDLVAALLKTANLEDTESLAARFEDVLRANPGFAWVSFSDVHGTFTGAYRAPGGELRWNRSHIEGGKTALLEERIDPGTRARTTLRSVADTGYDPRTRPFWTLATTRKKRVWTAPYVFFDQGVPGITCAEPVLDPSGALRGVVTVDFDLVVLSDFVKDVHLSPHATVFVATDDGVLLAHPRLGVVHATGKGAEGELVTKDNVADPTVRAFFAAAPAELGARSTRFAFDDAGQRMVATRVRFEVDEGVAWQVGAYAPESDFLGDVERANRIALAISLAAVALAVLLGTALARRIAVPLAKLSEDMERVGRFDLGGDAGTRSVFREIDSMDRSLQSMKKGLRSFASYVPRDLVRAVLASGEEAVLGGRTRTLTVFFSDLAGFTTIAESMKPADLVELLGDYLDAMTRVIAEQQGTVDKFIGDGIMAFWGAPKPLDDHALRAVTCALASREELEKLRARGGGLEKLQMRIGIATGDVVVGNIGSRERLNYTVIGDTANLAARLEGAGKQYALAVLVAESTLERCKDEILARPVDVLAVKGKSKGIKVYEPLALTARATEAERAFAALATKALATYLAREFEAARALYDELLALRPGDRAAEVLRDRCAAYAKDPPNEPWDGAWHATEK